MHKDMDRRLQVAHAVVEDVVLREEQLLGQDLRVFRRDRVVVQAVFLHLHACPRRYGAHELHLQWLLVRLHALASQHAVEGKHQLHHEGRAHQVARAQHSARHDRLVVVLGAVSLHVEHAHAVGVQRDHQHRQLGVLHLTRSSGAHQRAVVAAHVHTVLALAGEQQKDVGGSVVVEENLHVIGRHDLSVLRHQHGDGTVGGDGVAEPLK